MSKCACEDCGCLLMAKHAYADPWQYYCTHHDFCGVDFEKSKDLSTAKQIGSFESGFPEETPSWCPKKNTQSR